MGWKFWLNVPLVSRLSIVQGAINAAITIWWNCRASIANDVSALSQVGFGLTQPVTLCFIVQFHLTIINYVLITHLNATLHLILGCVRRSQSEAWWLSESEAQWLSVMVLWTKLLLRSEHRFDRLFGWNMQKMTNQNCTSLLFRLLLMGPNDRKKCDRIYFFGNCIQTTAMHQLIPWYFACTLHV